MTDFTDDLAAALAERYDLDDLAPDAAEKAGAFAEEYDLDLTVAGVVDGLEAAPYGEFRRRWNWWVGDRAANLEECTNSRAFRFAGFDAVAAIQ